jgi:CheY-like chemotaxis protein
MTASAREHGRVLLVEPNKLQRRATAAMLRRRGFDALAAADGEEALTTAHIPVIVVSRLVQESDRHQALAGGAAAYLDKADITLQDLARHVDEALSAARA